MYEKIKVTPMTQRSTSTLSSLRLEGAYKVSTVPLIDHVNE